MKERIRAVMEHLNLSQKDFAAQLDISPASLSSIFQGRTNPTNNHVMAVHRAFPDININWLMFGEGAMLTVTDTAKAQVAEATGAEGGTVAPVRDAQYAASVGASGLSPFSEVEAASMAAGMPVPPPAYGAGRSEMMGRKSGYMPNDYAINIDKRTRKIKEIRVFFDDGTYEAFVPSNK